MAAPEVAGTLALMRAEAPALTAAELKQALLATVDRKPQLAGRAVSGGRLNAATAVRAAMAAAGLAVPRADTDDDGVDVTLRHGDGREERVRARYLVGCDGAHSTVRKLAAIPFEGDAYEQRFMLGDIEADAAGRVHSFGCDGVVYNDGESESAGDAGRNSYRLAFWPRTRSPPVAATPRS